LEPKAALSLFLEFVAREDGFTAAALGLLDQYPWHMLSPQHVRPEFRRQILAAVQKRFESSDDPWGRMEKWRELCEGTNDPN
jgi:hypothetical protein